MAFPRVSGGLAGQGNEMETLGPFKGYIGMYIHTHIYLYIYIHM